jgi:phospholipid/cholesterol/gamma-HCH transport system substrate-binding protein
VSKAGIFETIVGAIVLAVAGVFLFYAYGVSGDEGARRGYNLEAVFGRVDGVTVGSEVRIAGVKVGTVAGNTLDTRTYEAKLRLSLESGVPVPDDSTAKIVSDGLLGGAHVAIEPGASETMLADGGRIEFTQGSVDLLGLAIQAFAPDKSKEGETAEDPLGELQ